MDNNDISLYPLGDFLKMIVIRKWWQLGVLKDGKMWIDFGDIDTLLLYFPVCLKIINLELCCDKL